MSNELIQLRKGGWLFGREWDVDKKDYVDFRIEEEELINYFDGDISLDDMVLLKDFFCMLYNYFDAISPFLVCNFLEDLINEAFEQKDEMEKGLHGLELVWVPVFSESLDGTFLNDYIDLIPLGEDVSLEFIPIYKLVHLPLYLNETFIINDLVIKRKFTFLSFISSIVENLSFMGPPSIRDFASKVKEDGVLIVDPSKLEEMMKNEQKKFPKPCIWCKKDSRSEEFKKESMCYSCYKKLREN